MDDDSVIAKWTGREYEHTPRGADWYWALGIIAAALAIAAGLFANYLLAVLIVIAAIALGLHAAKEPAEHVFRLTTEGIMVGDDLHPFDKIYSFSVLEDIAGEEPPVLSIKTAAWHSPHLFIPLEGVDADMLYAYLLQHIDEEEHQPTFVDLVALWLGF